MNINILPTLEEDERHYKDLNELLPYWASGYARGEFLVGAQLCTKDGRKIGNAVITDIIYDEHLEYEIFLVRTDFGNKKSLLLEEMREYFYPPKYIVREYGVL